MAAAARDAGAPFAMDVRVNWSDPAAGRPESGHDYRALLDRVDRLTLWCYTALAGVDPGEIRRLPDELDAAGLDVGRMILSVGLWTGEEGEPISSDELGEALRAGEESGARSVGVTPLSLMDTSHWEALAAEWR
jgi:hypothetical protein